MKTGSTVILKSTFEKVGQETIDILRHVAVRRTYPPQTYLIRQGQIEHTFYIVVSGRVAITRVLDDGTEQLLEMRGPNTFFGEMGLIDDQPRMASCITLIETTVLEVTEDIFDKLVHESPAVAYTMMRRILDNTRQTDQMMINDLQAKNKELEEAYRNLQVAQADLVVKERLERELELAADMQRKLLPDTLPQYPDYAFAAVLQPARQVGGDFYDVLHLDEEHVALLLADVADKGAHAALFMAVTRTLFAQEAKHSLSPADVACAVHYGMLNVAARADVFVTAFYGVLHRPTGKLTYVRAGQDRPLLYRKGQPVLPLKGKGRFLGMWPELTLQEYEIVLQPGDRLVMFSDGVPDAVNQQDDPYTTGRFAACLQANGHLSAAELARVLVADVADWSDGAASFDDLTLVVVEVSTDYGGAG